MSEATLLSLKRDVLQQFFRPLARAYIKTKSRPHYVRRIAPVAGGELGCGKHPKDKLDAGPRCAANALDQEVVRVRR
jgi:hypothetical protein